MNKYIYRLIALLSLVVLSGCIGFIDVRLSITEAIIFDDENTGHIMVDIGIDPSLSEQISSEEIGDRESELQSSSYLKNVKMTNDFDGTLYHIIITADVTDMMSFLEEDGSMGHLTKLSNGNYLYVYSLSLSDSSGSNAMVTDSNPNDYWTLMVKAPGVVNCNGTLDKSTGYYVWKTPMSMVLANNATIDAQLEFRPGLSTLEIIFILCAVCLCMFLIIAAIVIVFIIAYKYQRKRLGS